MSSKICPASILKTIISTDTSKAKSEAFKFQTWYCSAFPFWAIWTLTPLCIPQTSCSKDPKWNRSPCTTDAELKVTHTRNVHGVQNIYNYTATNPRTVEYQAVIICEYTCATRWKQMRIARNVRSSMESLHLPWQRTMKRISPAVPGKLSVNSQLTLVHQQVAKCALAPKGFSNSSAKRLIETSPKKNVMQLCSPLDHLGKSLSRLSTVVVEVSRLLRLKWRSKRLPRRDLWGSPEVHRGKSSADWGNQREDWRMLRESDRAKQWPCSKWRQQASSRQAAIPIVVLHSADVRVPRNNRPMAPKSASWNHLQWTEIIQNRTSCAHFSSQEFSSLSHSTSPRKWSTRNRQNTFGQ